MTKPENWLLICVEPAATLDCCRNSAVSSMPRSMLVSAVMTCTGEMESYSSLRISEPVTMTRSSVTASSGSEEACSCGSSACCCASAACSCGSSDCGSCANAVAPYRHPNTAAASGTSFRLANVFLPLEPVIAYSPVNIEL